VSLLFAATNAVNGVVLLKTLLLTILYHAAMVAIITQKTYKLSVKNAIPGK